MVETMKWENGKLILLDQTKLPVSVEWISCDTYQRVGKAIQKLEVRGAPAIGAAAAFAMVLAWRKIVEKYETKRDAANTSNMQLQTYAAMLYGSHDHAAKKLQQQLLKKFLQARNDLDASRPTAVNLSWATKLMYDAACKMTEAGLDLPQTDAELEKLAVKVYEQDIAKNRKMGEYGKVKMVYSDETRPLLQGSRLTAWELLEDNIPVTTITDNMAAWSMKTKGINIVITGADRIAANGDTANKIGTYGVALAAKAHGIPFYIAAPASTFDFSLKNGTQIPIEERNANEVRSFQGKVSAPKNVNVFNPAFDVTPAKLIAGIITEYGVLRPPFSKSIKELKTKVLREELFTWKA